MPASNAVLERCAELFAGRTIPVLARSIDALARLKRDEDTVNPREVANTVLRDPMLTLIVLRHLQTHRSQRRLEDITTVEHAIMMLGLQRFFSAFEVMEAVEDGLASRPEALAGLMQAIGRSRAAANYAGSIAALRADLQGDEVVIAALLHDMAEILLWCFEPDQAVAITALLEKTPGMRSADAQRQVLGFALLDLQLSLVRRWGLPDLLLALMDDEDAEKPRVRNVTLAVALSRHAAHGWSNAALPDDLTGIGRLLGLAPNDVRTRVFDATLRSIVERSWYGAALRGAWLPALPVAAARAGTEQDSPTTQRGHAYDAASAWLEGIRRGQPQQGRPRQGMLRDVRPDQLSALVALMDGAQAGLGYASGVVLAPDAKGRRLAAQFLAGEGRTMAYLEADPIAAKAVLGAVTSRTAAVHVGRPEGGRPRGTFAYPLTSTDAGICALAVVSDPAELSCLGAESFQRFKALGEKAQAGLDALGTAPFWLAAAGDGPRGG